MILELQFRGEQPLLTVRRFLADAVRLFRPELDGDWVETKREVRPHAFLPLIPELARVEFSLGDATLVQVVQGDSHGNPRDGAGYEVEFDCRFLAADQSKRRLSHWAWTYDPFPSALAWRLEGFSAAEFHRLRALGQDTLGEDHTADASTALVNVRQLQQEGAHLDARALVIEACLADQSKQAPSVRAELDAVRRQLRLGVMHLSFPKSVAWEPLRAYLADVVRLVKPDAVGDWQLVRSTPLPHAVLSGPELAKTEWALGPATLVQKVQGGSSGDPREGWGYDLDLALQLEGRTLTLSNSAWEPVPQALHFQLEGFTPSELMRARELGRTRFGVDDSGQLAWAAANAHAFAFAGARVEARQLIDESLSRAPGSWERLFHRELQRLRVALSEDASERARGEGAVTLGEPTALWRLERLASGRVQWPPWTSETAARVLQLLQPSSMDGPWRSHPWWPGVEAGSLAGWSTRREQPMQRVQRDGQWVLQDVGAPVKVPLWASLHLVLRTLELNDFLGPAREGKPDGVVTSLEPLAVSAVVSLHTAQAWWTWCWSGRVGRGAVLAFRFTPGQRRHADETPYETHLAWLGTPDEVAALEAKLRALHPPVRTFPAAP